MESEAIKGRPLALIFKFRGGITVLSVKHYAVYMQHKICLLLKLSRNEECMRKKTDMMFIAIINLFCTDYVQIKRTKARRERRKNKKGENTLILKKKNQISDLGNSYHARSKGRVSQYNLPAHQQAKTESWK